MWSFAAGGVEGSSPQNSPLLEATPGTFYGAARSDSGGIVYRLHVADALLAEDRLLSAEEGIPISGQLTAAGADTASLTFALVATGSRGTATMSPTGAFTYLATVNGGLTGRDTFTFVVSDGLRTSNVGTVSVLISAVNDPPVAFDASISATPDVPVSGTLRAIDPEGRSLWYYLTSQPTQGTIVLNSLTGQFVYTAGPAAAGEDAVTFRVAEFVEQGVSYASNVATVTIALSSTSPAVALTLPAGGEKLFINWPAQIAWTATGATSVDVELSHDGGQRFSPIAECSALPASASGCQWLPQGPPTLNARIRIVARGAAGQTVSAESRDFTIARGRPRLTIAAPPMRVAIGSTLGIGWQHNLGMASVRIELSRDGGASWEVIAPSVQNLTEFVGGFEWTVTGPATRTGRLRVTSLSTGVSDGSGRLVILDSRDP